MRSLFDSLYPFTLLLHPLEILPCIGELTILSNPLSEVVGGFTTSTLSGEENAEVVVRGGIVRLEDESSIWLHRRTGADARSDRRGPVGR